MKNPDVVIIGLGYIGLPSAAILASNGVKVFGVDINKDIVNTINNGQIHIKEKNLESTVSTVVKNGFLKCRIKACSVKNLFDCSSNPF